MFKEKGRGEEEKREKVKGLNRREPFGIKRLRSSLRIAVRKNNENFLRNILTRIKSEVIVCPSFKNQSKVLGLFIPPRVGRGKAKNFQEIS